MQEETVREVDMMYIKGTGGTNFSVETMSKRSQNIKMNFTGVNGIEINVPGSLEIKNSYIQMADDQPKIWNMRFAYPTNFKIRYTGKIVIEVI
jgi:hypothetical protein